MKDNRTETGKLIHSFISITIVLTSAILIAMGIFAAKNNTDALDSGLTPAMIYAARENEQISIQIDKTLYQSNKIRQLPIETIASLSPAPLGGFYLVYKNIYSLIAGNE